ncbi:MAG: hypothetical protein RL701_7755 [Pseudomonadota bacterium]|jgi:hypothetical protein
MPQLEERTVLWIRGVPDRDAPASNAVQWLERTLRGAQLSGGHVELTLGSTLVATFDGVDLEDAVDFARHTLDIARECTPPIAVHVGLALGEVGRRLGQEGEALAWLGAAFDRAQVLCQRARPYEIVFDEAAEQRGEEQWLFGREVFAERVRGHALEALHFSKRACRAALQHLRPAPLPTSALAVFDQLQRLTTARGQQRAALHASSRETAVDCVERILALQPPALRLVVSSSAGSLRPLGSLALALHRLWPSAEALGLTPLPEEARSVFRALTTGAVVQRADIVEALTNLLRTHTNAQARPSIVLEDLSEIDPATLAVLAEVLLVADLDAFVLMTLPLDASVPAQLMPLIPRASQAPAVVTQHASTESLHELFLPALPMEDRVLIAKAVLSLEAGSEVAQRVALLGGPHLHGLIEAIRTLVSSGDLVWNDESSSFAWRRGPRQGANSVPVEALITERVVGLTPNAYRALEVLCSCPRQTTREFVRRVAALDGVSAEEYRAGIDPLYSEGWLDAAFSLGSADSTVRAIMRQLMPPARAVELQSFVASLLRADMPDACFGSGEIAYHLLEAGQGALAANALVEAAHSAMETGFQRMALRLLATAVEWEPSLQIRKAARQIARVVGPAAAGETRAAPRSVQPPLADDYEEIKSDELERPESMAKAAMRSALEALAQRDFEAMERCLDAVCAAGGSRAAAQRVLSLSHVLRGDMDNAIAALQRGHHDAHADTASLAVRARDTLCWAIVRLAGGFENEAVRVAFTALALARRQNDAHGEAASLQVLALVYRSLDRDEDALQLEAAAANQLRAFVPLSHPA